MKRIMEVSKKNTRILSKAKGSGAQVSMIPVLRSLNRHQVYNQLNEKLDLNRAEKRQMVIGGRGILEVLALQNLISRTWLNCLLSLGEKIQNRRSK